MNTFSKKQEEDREKEAMAKLIKRRNKKAEKEALLPANKDLNKSPMSSTNGQQERVFENKITQTKFKGYQISDLQNKLKTFHQW